MRKLDLGCGANKPEGFEGADIAPLPGVDHVFDLMQFPWPFEDGTFDELRSSHYVEHIPQAFYTPNPRFPIGRNITALAEGPHSVSLFLKFFAECWRVLKPGGSIQVFCPHGHSDRAFQDPTHARFLVGSSWDYLDADFRRMNGLEHAAYAIECHFPASLRHVGASMLDQQLKALKLMPDFRGSAGLGDQRSVQDLAVERFWNMVADFQAVFVKAPMPARKDAEKSAESSSARKEALAAST